MPAFFVTATGTDIGKTFVGSCLLRHWRAAGVPADAFKPLVSGIDPADPAGSDPAVLLEALGRDPSSQADLDSMSPWRFAAPLAPNMAARAEGRQVDYPAVLAACRRRLARTDGMLLVEGVGGVMAPVDDGRTVLDWMGDLGLPALLVAGTYLGTISHILTAHAVLAGRGLRVAALVLSETPGTTPGATVPVDATLAALAPFLPDVPAVALPRLAAGQDGADHPAIRRLAGLLAAGA
ncbi:dethiobiotin synthase [Niveispirillum fermenti]|uniref:dethiobiotin synthase n=1 Tax=Niveispirillum fermenti TaxID=1233113 RepID=UPI003A8C1E81